MTTRSILPMSLESFYELYKRGCLKLDRNACVTFKKYNEEGYPEVDPNDFLERFPFFDADDQGIILECELDKKAFEEVGFNITGTIYGDSLTLNSIRTDQKSYSLRIENIVRVFPLSENAAHILPSKIGEEIFLEKPMFQTLVAQAGDKHKKDIQDKGVDALFKINRLDIPDERETLDHLFELANKLKSSFQKPEKQDRFLIHALVYERREPFPKSDIGILFDLCKILADKEDATNYRTTKFYENLDTIKSEKDHDGIVKVLQHFENESCYEKVRKLASYDKPLKKDYITAALFTKYKELLRDDSYNPIMMVMEIKEFYHVFPEETKFALYLIGKFFTYNRFYNALYVSKGLRVLKKLHMGSDLSNEESPPPSIEQECRAVPLAESGKAIEELRNYSAEAELSKEITHLESKEPFSGELNSENIQQIEEFKKETLQGSQIVDKKIQENKGLPFHADLQQPSEGKQESKAKNKRQNSGSKKK